MMNRNRSARKPETSVATMVNSNDFQSQHTSKSACPISKLAAGLLSEIFLVVAAYSRVSAIHPGYLSPTELRICTIGVCRHWRAVTMGCARLWSYIDFSRDWPGRMEETLLRSKATPFVVRATLHWPCALENVSLALEDISRIQCLDLGFETRHFALFLRGIWKAAPALECQTIALFLPAMRELELRGCGIPLAETSHLLRNLTYLSVDELSKCFSRCEEFHCNLPLIPLSELFSVALEGCAEDRSDILNHFVFPSIPCFEITCDLDYFDGDIYPFSDLLDTLGKLLQNLPPAQKLWSLGISWTTDRLKIFASTDETGDVSPESEDSEFYLEVCVPENSEDLYTLMLAVLDKLPTSDIAVLDLGMPLCRDSLHTYFSFTCANVLRRPLALISIGAVSSVTFPSNTTGRALSCPSLLARIHKPATPFNFSLRCTHSDLSTVNTAFDLPGIIPSLMCLLRRRRANGSPIAKTRVDFCTNVASKIQLLRNAGVALSGMGMTAFRTRKNCFELQTMRTRAD
ncbi:hypothetical protein C8R44DRAFT_724303 [Mycena epipterygia]|nr:hypothetical protein C8R44DRAFT_724303 [Mycena epipterygia]